MSKILIVNEMIEEMDVDAIVNATSESMWVETVLENRIFKKAGRMEMTRECDRIGRIPTGSAVIIPGHQLKAKYLIHAVGPVWRGGGNREAVLLDRVYRNVMALAEKNDVHSIAFSLISIELFKYPVEEAWKIALDAVEDYLLQHEETDLTVYFCVESPHVREMGLLMQREREEAEATRTGLSLRHVFTVTCKVAKPIVYGQDEVNGRCQAIPILEGEVTGRDLDGKPMIGTLLPGGVDSQTIRPNGVCELSARYGVRLSDGRSFYIENNGIRTVPDAYVKNVLKGEFVSSDLYYFATTPHIEAYHESLRWLERHVFLCKAVREESAVRIMYYMIEK